MMWVLMVLLGGTTGQSGVAIDMTQEFVTEDLCVETRDQIRAVNQARTEMSRSNNYLKMEAHCVPRSVRFPSHGQR